MTYEHFLKLRFDKNPKDWFENILKNSNHPKIPYVKSVQVLTNNFQHWSVEKIIEDWKKKDILEVENNLDNTNWMYYHCIKYRFRRGLDEQDINIYAATEDKKDPNESDAFLSSLIEMSDDEVGSFLKNSPVTVSGKFIMNGFHRSCAMIGRIIINKPYIDIGGFDARK